ncbi:MAG TPA: hypothetical protein PKD24_04455 [Pyrinomonadaceae bacterium]|nr:hypothetical protein [Pyrinomonadaceae bacterium]HMP64803.1 hypothetical protein [Pyrinomonadaceae bacterium]
MSEKTVRDLANDALGFTKRGLEMIVETYDMQAAALSMPLNRDFEQIVHEIARKQKLAVELIQNAMTIEKGLMQRQAEAIQKLIGKL